MNNYISINVLIVALMCMSSSNCDLFEFQDKQNNNGSNHSTAAPSEETTSGISTTTMDVLTTNATESPNTSPNTDSPTTNAITTPTHTTKQAKDSVPAKQGRHFDGGSFVGGMVLSASLIVIGFFAYKFYMQRKGTPYRNF